MKILLNRQQILSATLPLLGSTSNKSTIPSIEGILIEAKFPDLCTFTSYDLEKGIKTTLETKVLEEGSYIINAQKFVQTLRVMDGEEVELSVNQDLCATFVCGKSSHKMNALKGENFPELPMLESEKGFSVLEGTFKRQLSKTMFAMGVEDQRPVLNGCFCLVEDGSVLLVSCDSFKMAKCLVRTELKNENADGSALQYRFIIPGKTVNELYKLLSEDEDRYVTIQMTRKHIIFRFENILFFSRLIDGEYIDYNRIIVKQHKIHVTLQRDALLSALERAALITEERVSGNVRSHVKLQFEGNILKIMAASTAGSTYDEIPITHEGEDLLIAFNNRYLTDSVRACDCETIRMSLSSPLHSVNIEPAEEDENREEIFMLLPVKMKE